MHRCCLVKVFCQPVYDDTEWISFLHLLERFKSRIELFCELEEPLLFVVKQAFFNLCRIAIKTI